MKRKGILQFIKNCLADPNYNRIISDNLVVVALMKTILSDIHKHYGFIDRESKNKYSCHQLRFELLYMVSNNNTFDDIAEETYLKDGKKVQKHAKNYNNLALKTIEEEANCNNDYALLLSEYKKSGL